jgi:hypothetical protein
MVPVNGTYFFFVPLDLDFGTGVTFIKFGSTTLECST